VAGCKKGRARRETNWVGHIVRETTYAYGRGGGKSKKGEEGTRIEDGIGNGGFSIYTLLCDAQSSHFPFLF